VINKIIPFFIAAGIGFAIGIERERRYANSPKAMGERTFVLLALLGALAGYVAEPLIAMSITILASALIVAAYVQTTKLLAPQSIDLGLTTEFAAGVTFVIGYMSHQEPFLCAILGLLTLVVLLSRERLHEFTIKQIRSEEIQAAVVLFVLGLGVLPLLKDAPVDPWGLLNFYRFVMLLLLIGSIQFVGYLATRFFGPIIGFPLSGFVSGFVSSTAVFLIMPERVKENPKIVHAATAAALFAAAATFIFLFVVIFSISAPLAMEIAPPLLVSVVIAGAIGYFFSRRDTDGHQFPEPKNPLSMLAALRLAVILSGFIIAIGFVQHFIGDFGTEIAAFVVGLGELHGVSIASASLFANGKVPMEIAKASILLAALGSLTSKVIIALVLRREHYTLWVTSTVLLMTVASVATWYVL
jgi:uncharacterized membrane protein (DUF4010 family)